MHSTTTHNKTPQLVVGLLIIGAGLLFLLDHLGMLDAGEYLRYWPALLVVYGFSRMAGGQRKGLIVGGLFVFIGGLMLMQKFDLIDFSIWRLWPLALVGIGALLVRRAFRGRPQSKDGIAEDGDSVVNVFVMLGGVERKNTSGSFAGGEITTILGGCKLDLRDAQMKGQEAVLDVFAFWGGIDIRVPDDWSVSVESIPLMGGCEDKSRSTSTGGRKHLIIRGYVIMGGVEIG